MKDSSVIQKLVDRLKRIGTFIKLIKLYPSNAIGSLRITCVYAKEYNAKIEELKTFAKEKMGNTTYSAPILAHLFGLGKVNLEKKPSKQKQITMEFHEILQKEKEGLVTDLRMLWRTMNVISVMEEVLSELKEFMEENSLSIPPIKEEIDSFSIES